ncbi:hypothetical protein [Lacticaseibacillus daqingensis]|uniref:hypothetical protein n=1 Tax=Lacticaseibacillus daqingensis TaxID=2486014 RepID=UPI0013DDDAAF|nr:hypothetical protein [Lacticaseibacillus daqingensis]
MTELVEHRLNGMSDEQIQKAIADNDPTFSWRVTYAKRDCLRAYYKAKRQQQQAANGLVTMVQDSYSIIDMDRATRTQDDVQAAIELLPQIFANRSTCAWVESVLRVGAEETQARYHQSRRQFSQKTNRVCRYASQHRKKLIGIMSNRQDETELKELEALTQWAAMMANEDVTDKQIQHFLDQHGSLVADIVDTPKIKHQGKLVADWANADHADQYAFCNIMAARKERLEQYLVLR